MLIRIFSPTCGCVMLMMFWTAPVRAEEPIDFNRDIRPILSETCYACHGPSSNNREAELRLDTEEGAFGKAESGATPVVPGKPDESEMYRRLTADDPDERMPPAETEKTLTPEQIARFKKWIQQGAKWQGHWSFENLKRPPLPKIKKTSWPKGAIDHFVMARLEKEGLQPKAEANRITLIRRVTFDLTGLPPTLAEIDAFVADKSPDAYKKVVDRLLKSPRYGEHLARFWLDAARYGDTHGLHLDNYRMMWPYRDWVINALNKNMPFNQFVVEQMAGDLIPNATIEQRIASGFNRCNVTTSEGGSINEEYRVRYASDRVRTLGTVFLGLSMDCATCHEHKYDPISQEEFYSLYAYFYNFAENEMDANAAAPPGPLERIISAQQKQQQAKLKQAIGALQLQQKNALAAYQYSEPKSGDGDASQNAIEEIVWVDDDVPSGATAQGNTPWQFVSAPDHPVYSGSKSSFRSAVGLSQHFFDGAKQGLKIKAGDRLFTYVFIDSKNPPKQIMLQWNNGNWEHRAYWGQDQIAWGKQGTPGRVSIGKLPAAGKWVRLEVDAAKVGLKPGAVVKGWAYTQFDGAVHWDKSGIVRDSRRFESLIGWQQHVRNSGDKSVPEALRKMISAGVAKQSPGQKKQIRNYFLKNIYAKSRAVLKPLDQKIAEAQKQLVTASKSTITTLIMGDLPRTDKRWKTPRFLNRGAYDKPGDEAEPGVPASLPALPEGAPNNRLGLARWIVDEKNPLTARVTVNRYWQHYFGVGIVKTTEEFGSQGDWPSHPKLLDWLASEFKQSGWDIRHMQRLIVMSSTYRQSSIASPESYKRDKDNQLLARGPRYRLDAEMVRDNALAISGLLVEKIGGPSVKPYQPLGIWKAVGYTSSNTANFKQDHGASLYRRSMYTFWKRTAPPPSMSTFDAPSRENCTVRRERTNTPLQALTLMNDVQFVEAARALAQRAMLEGGKTSAGRIAHAFRLATGRKPDANEMALFQSAYAANLADFKKDPAAAKKLISLGESKRDESLDACEHAAWTMIANLILNMDETITKE